ncbi:MAG: outer membrane protein assembly factor BamE [Alphaproteobacteria bacterium]|nr:outer membrane protein assembly factor BamE [Alphaproteobacteria bacterium]
MFYLLLLMVGCSPIIHHQGKIIEEASLKEIACGRHTREDVERILGSPSTLATFNDKTWYYISKTTEAKAFFTPEVIDQKTIAITFDDAGYVKEISARKLADAQDIEFVERVTPTTGHSMTFLQQVFGNFGRIARQDKKF